MNERDLENFYREHLEEEIIFTLCSRKGISWEAAMELFYGSSLALRIYHGDYGIQYLDASVLTNLLEKETEGKQCCDVH